MRLRRGLRTIIVSTTAELDDLEPISDTFSLFNLLILDIFILFYTFIFFHFFDKEISIHGWRNIYWFAIWNYNFMVFSWIEYRLNFLNFMNNGRYAILIFLFFSGNKHFQLLLQNFYFYKVTTVHYYTRIKSFSGISHISNNIRYTESIIISSRYVP